MVVPLGLLQNKMLDLRSIGDILLQRILDFIDF